MGLDLCSLRFMGRTLNQSDKVSSWVRADRGISALISITLRVHELLFYLVNIALSTRGVNIRYHAAAALNNSFKS